MTDRAGLSGDALRLGLMGVAWPMRGGIAQYTTSLAAELAKRHRFDLVSFTRQYPSFLFPGKSQLDPSADRSRFSATTADRQHQPVELGARGAAPGPGTPRRPRCTSTGCRSSRPPSGRSPGG